MATTTVNYQGTREEILALVRSLPRIFAGTDVDRFDLAKGLQLRLGVGLLSKIQQAFVIKSRGGTGSDGIKWQPLKPSTIAQRRIGPGDLRSIGIKGTTHNRVRGLLTKAQDLRWKKIFGSRLAYFMAKFGMSHRDAAARAAQIAWTILKSEGAVTKLDVLGKRQVDILKDTGELFQSLSPGVDDQPSGAEGQIFRVTPGLVRVGTNKKPWHHKGIKGKLPARPLWPEDGKLPDAWWEDLLGLTVSGVVRAMALLLTRGRIGP